MYTLIDLLRSMRACVCVCVCECERETRAHMRVCVPRCLYVVMCACISYAHICACIMRLPVFILHVSLCLITGATNTLPSCPPPAPWCVTLTMLAARYPTVPPPPPLHPSCHLARLPHLADPRSPPTPTPTRCPTQVSQTRWHKCDQVRLL